MRPAASGGERARHPAARARGDHLVPLARRVAATGDLAGPHRSVAVAAQAVRGRQGRSVATFAAAYGVEDALVVALEAGWIPVDDVPAPLRVLTGMAAIASALAADPVCPN